MAILKNKFIKLLFVVFLVGFSAVAVYYAGEYFKGQLFLQKTGIDVFPAGGDTNNYPVFSLCEEKDKCTKKITIKFQLENGKYINQLSLENAVIKDGGGKTMPVSLVEDKSKTAIILKEGDLKGKTLNTGKLKLGEKEALYFKESTGITFIVPNEGKFDLLNNGYYFDAPAGDADVKVIKILTYEAKSQDGKSTIFAALPDIYADRVGDIKIFAENNLKITDEVNDKISKRLGTSKAPCYIIISSQSITPDFVRAPSYTARGMAWALKNMASKYGLNFEKVYKNCGKAGNFATSKCWEDKTTIDSVIYTMKHELTHIFQIENGTKDKVKNNYAYLEGLAELNAYTLDSLDWTKVSTQYKDKEKCKSIKDVYKSGMCMIQYFKNEITEANIKNLFLLKKSYDLDKNFCSGWWDIMKEATEKDLTNLKADYDSKICK